MQSGGQAGIAKQAARHAFHHEEGRARDPPVLAQDAGGEWDVRRLQRPQHAEFAVDAARRGQGSGGAFAWDILARPPVTAYGLQIANRMGEAMGETASRAGHFRTRAGGGQEAVERGFVESVLRRDVDGTARRRSEGGILHFKTDIDPLPRREVAAGAAMPPPAYVCRTSPT